MNISSEALVSFVAAYMWPFFRVAAIVSVVPIFGARIVPPRVRSGLAVLLTLVIVPLLPPIAPVDPLSALGLLTGATQILIGLVMGFAIRIVFSALETGGHIIGQTMGLGFAQMIDPNNGVTVPVVSQFYTAMATLLFIVLNGHLLIIDVLVGSFHTMPVLAHGVAQGGLWTLLSWASWIFSGAVLVSLPAVAALLLVNVAFGVMMRAAPQLNIFAVGFPITLLLGFAFMLVSLPVFLPQFTHLIDAAFTTIATIVTRNQ